LSIEVNQVDLSTGGSTDGGIEGVGLSPDLTPDNSVGGKDISSGSENGSSDTSREGKLGGFGEVPHNLGLVGEEGIEGNSSSCSDGSRGSLNVDQDQSDIGLDIDFDGIGSSQISSVNSEDGPLADGSEGELRSGSIVDNIDGSSGSIQVVEGRGWLESQEGKSNQSGIIEFGDSTIRSSELGVLGGV